MFPKQKTAFSLMLWLSLLAAANFFDFLTTQKLVVRGGWKELNPLMARLIGTPFFPVYKLLLIPLGLVFLWSKRTTVIQKYFRLIKCVSSIYGLLTAYNIVILLAMVA